MSGIHKTNSDATLKHNCVAPSLPWFAVRIKSNCERRSAASLQARGFEAFLPTYIEKRQWSDRQTLSEFPLFPGYLFCRLDQTLRSPVLSVPGVIGIVSCGLQMLPVSDEEVDAVRRAASGSHAVQQWPYLRIGHRVRVTQGALTGVEGLVVEEGKNLRLVLQIHLLQRSISLQIDRDCIEPLKDVVRAHE